MATPHTEARSTVRYAAIIAVSAVLVVVVGFLAYDLWSFGTTGRLTPRHRTADAINMIRRRALQKPPTVDQIESWMTFDYINRVFHLPSDYLKTSLSITDSRYPNMSINRFARSTSSTDPLAATDSVKAAVRTFEAASSTSATSSTMP